MKLKEVILKRDKPEVKSKTIKYQIYKLLAIVMIPLMIISVTLLVLLFKFNQEYSASLQNATIAGEFNSDFKSKLDLDMWYYAIRPGDYNELPWDEVAQAEEVLYRLQETTTLSDNKWRIEAMLNMCNYLREYMKDMEKTEKYGDRLNQLEDNIYSVTSLITTYMHDYIYYEIQELTYLQSNINAQVLTTVALTIVIFLIVIFIIAISSVRFSRQITHPISELCRKAKKLGRGDFSVDPLITYIDEIKTLDDGFNEMVLKINKHIDKEKQDQQSLHRAELELLQSQINPHFLYNTLDSIVWLAETHKYNEVIKMVTSLSIFFRTSLSNGHDIIDIADEKKQVSSYLEIQKIRYNDILEYEINLPKSLLKYTIPKLTLEPLVENALYHGIKYKRAVGKIIIDGYEEEGGIVLRVKDDGIGMSEEKLESLRNGIYKECHTGLGLLNVYKRIKLYCGEGYGMTFDSILGEGSTVSVRISKNIKKLS